MDCMDGTCGAHSSDHCWPCMHLHLHLHLTVHVKGATLSQRGDRVSRQADATWALMMGVCGVSMQ